MQDAGRLAGVWHFFMDARSILVIIGGFCMSFGALLVSRAESRFGWWTGQGMLIAGPLLMTARAVKKSPPRRAPVRRRRKAPARR